MPVSSNTSKMSRYSGCMMESASAAASSAASSFIPSVSSLLLLDRRNGALLENTTNETESHIKASMGPVSMANYKDSKVAVLPKHLLIHIIMQSLHWPHIIPITKLIRDFEKSQIRYLGPTLRSCLRGKASCGVTDTQQGYGGWRYQKLNLFDRKWCINFAHICNFTILLS